MSDFQSGDPGSSERMLRNTWDADVTRVTVAMQEYTKQFVTAISKVIDYDYGKLLGTGNYIELQGQRFLMTNEHVAGGMAANSLAHQFQECDSVFRVTNPFYTFPRPIDVGVSSIDDKVWNGSAHASNTSRKFEYFTGRNGIN